MQHQFDYPMYYVDRGYGHSAAPYPHRQDSRFPQPQRDPHAPYGPRQAKPAHQSIYRIAKQVARRSSPEYETAVPRHLSGRSSPTSVYQPGYYAHHAYSSAYPSDLPVPAPCYTASWGSVSVSTTPPEYAPSYTIRLTPAEFDTQLERVPVNHTPCDAEVSNIALSVTESVLGELVDSDCSFECTPASNAQDCVSTPECDFTSVIRAAMHAGAEDARRSSVSTGTASPPWYSASSSPISTLSFEPLQE